MEPLSPTEKARIFDPGLLLIWEHPSVATSTLTSKLSALDGLLRSAGKVVVAFSGGTDSSLVAAAAARALGAKALAVTAVSASLPPGEAEDARRVAAAIGIAHRLVRTRETQKPEYLVNGFDRCYHCKTELYDVLATVAAESGGATVVSGANLDDLHDVRPGLAAASEHGVRHPLVEAGFTKQEVRSAARELGVPNWDKPASACLSSRIAHGVTITVDMLSKVGRAERLLRELGFRQCRVRVHGDIVRVEVEAEQIQRLGDPEVRLRIVEGLHGLGYRYVTMDLDGFRSGSMNPLPDGSDRG